VLGILFSVFLQSAPGDRPVFTGFDIAREKNEHKVIVVAALKNPARSDLADLWVSVVYFDGDRELRTSNSARIPRLTTKEPASVTLEARQVEKFSRYEVMVESGGEKLVYAGTPSEETPRLKRVESAPVRAPDARTTVEARGLKWFNRDPLDPKQEGPGDVPFLRLAIRGKGQTVHPSGKIQVMLFDGKKPLRFLNIGIADACYRKDAGELNATTAVPETVAYDPINGEVWIGLARVDPAVTSLRADVTLILEAYGTWEWKGLEKSFTSDPCPPGKK